MSKVVKYYYSNPLMKGVITSNPILDKFVISKVRQGKRYTIAAVYNDDDCTIKFGLATCQPCDNFCKRIGREIAERNALENPFYVIENFSGRRNDYADQVMAIMIEKEACLLKKDNPGLFNQNNFVN